MLSRPNHLAYCLVCSYIYKKMFILSSLWSGTKYILWNKATLYLYSSSSYAGILFAQPCIILEERYLLYRIDLLVWIIWIQNKVLWNCWKSCYMPNSATIINYENTVVNLFLLTHVIIRVFNLTVTSYAWSCGG